MPALRLVYPYGEAAFVEEVRAEERQYQQHHAPWTFEVLARRARGKAIRLNATWGCKSPTRDIALRDQDKAETRASCYRSAGRYLAENVDMMIAVWDGVHSGRIGHTSDGVLYATSEQCQQARAKAGREPLDVHWLAVPRQSNPFPAGEAFTWQRLSLPAPVSTPGAKTLRRHVRKLQVALPAVLAAASFAVSFAGYLLHRAGAPIAMPAITDASETCANPRSATIAFGSPPALTITSQTSFAALPVISAAFCLSDSHAPTARC